MKCNATWITLTISSYFVLSIGCSYTPPQSNGSGGQGGNAASSSSGTGGDGGTAGAGGTGGIAGAGGQAGGGGSPPCVDKEVRSCYGGPFPAKGKGLCQPVEQTCEDGVWPECKGFVVPTSEACASQDDTNCDGFVGCTGTAIKAQSELTPGDDMILAMVTTPAEGGFDGVSYAVGIRNALIQNLLADVPPTSSQVLFWRRQRLGGVNDWSGQFSFMPFQPGAGTAYGTGVAYNTTTDEIIVVGVTNNGLLAAMGQAPLALTLKNGFLTVFSINGTAKFIKAIGNPAEAGDTVEARAVAVDSSGNIYVVGHYTGSINFGGQMDAPTGAGRDGFIVSYTSTGMFRWQTFFTGAGDQSVDAIRINENNEIFIAARFADTVAFNAGVVTASGANDILLARILDSNNPSEAGSALWSVTVGGDQDDLVGGLAASTHAVYLSGMFRGNIVLGPSSVQSTDTSPFWDTYVAQFSTAKGEASNAFPMVHAGTQAIRSIAIDSFGDVVVAGAFSSSLPTNVGALFTTGANDFDAFAMKLDGKLTPRWATDFGDTLLQVAPAVVIGSTTGHVIIGGGFQSTLTGIPNPPSNTGDFDAFTAELAN
ncbi:MAG: SBBP repeat-containing protein [Polyangiaceae bacterium]|nr:SBBP repeat-containing protein [Polyangiaceae bacterium]